MARAFSHWQHNASRGLETLGFEAALDAEPARLAGEADRLAADAGYRSDAHRLWSYTARGEYADQLQRWLSVYRSDQLLVLRSEDLYERPAQTYTRVLEFLGLEHKTLDSYPRYTRRTSTASCAGMVTLWRTDRCARLPEGLVVDFMHPFYRSAPLWCTCWRLLVYFGRACSPCTPRIYGSTNSLF